MGFTVCLVPRCNGRNFDTSLVRDYVHRCIFQSSHHPSSPSPSGPHSSGDDLDKMDKTLVVDILVHAGAPVLSGDRKEGRAGRGVAGRGGAEEAELKEVKHDLNGGGGLLTTITITSTAELWWLTNTFFCPLRNKF